MAWNQSRIENGKRRIENGGKSSVLNPRFAILAFVIIVATAGAAWWALMAREESTTRPSDDRRGHGMIAEATPAPPPKTAEKEKHALPLNVKRDHSELTREELLTKVPHWAYTVEDRKRVDPGYAKKHERFLERKEKNPWKTYADNSLAMLLFGDGNLGFMPRFMPSFKDTFLKSLETPIIVSKDDPPELQEQKRQLVETKKWLKDQLDDGKDIVAILNEEYDRQKKISGLRETLRREMIEVQRTARSVQEVEDYVAAANEMLKAAGDDRTFKFSTMMTRLRLQREAELGGGAAGQQEGGNQ